MTNEAMNPSPSESRAEVEAALTAATLLTPENGEPFRERIARVSKRGVDRELADLLYELARALIHEDETLGADMAWFVEPPLSEGLLGESKLMASRAAIVGDLEEMGGRSTLLAAGSLLEHLKGIEGDTFRAEALSVIVNFKTGAAIEAMAAAQRAVEMAETKLERTCAHLQLVATLNNLGRGDEALGAIEKAVGILGPLRSLQFDLACARAVKSDSQGFQDAVSAIPTIQPDDSDPRSWRDLINANSDWLAERLGTSSDDVLKAFPEELLR